MLIAAIRQSQPVPGVVWSSAGQSINSSYTVKTQRYLERINVHATGADLATLKKLQHHHLLAIPFENLDIYWNRNIVLDIEASYEKVVINGRGGFCYELNGLFDVLLRDLGFETRLISARVYHADGSTGPEFDHAAVIVMIDGNPYLTDVGFGDFAAEPLWLVVNEPQEDPAGTFVIRKIDETEFDVAKQVNGDWKGQYVFTDQSRELSDFTEMCDFQQFSPDSHFKKGPICSILIKDGRKTLTKAELIITWKDSRSASAIESEDDFYQILADQFQIPRPSPQI